jgi:hypothetical protein
MMAMAPPTATTPTATTPTATKVFARTSPRKEQHVRIPDSASVFSPPTSPFDLRSVDERRAAAKTAMALSAAVAAIAEAPPQSLDLLLASEADNSSLSAAVEADAPTSLLVELSSPSSGREQAPPLAHRRDLSSAATTIQRALRFRAVRAQRVRAVEAHYHSLVREEDELHLDATAEMAQLLLLIEAAVERESVGLDEFQEAHLELELLRSEEALAEARWAASFGDLVRREADSLSSPGREQAARKIQGAYRGKQAREAHEYDGDEFEVESEEEEIDEEIEEGPSIPSSWAIDEVFTAGCEPQGVTGASMLLEATMSKTFVALAAVVAAVHGGALGFSITGLVSGGE